MLPLHSEAAHLLKHEAVGASVDQAPTFELLHYNGLASAGHRHKRALKAITLRPGLAKCHSLGDDGLAAVLQTR